MLSAGNSVQSATIVDRRSGPGYRLVLCRKSASGTPVLETLPESFTSVAAAERYAMDSLEITPAQLRVKVRSHA